MWVALRQRGVSKKIIRLLKSSYHGARVNFISLFLLVVGNVLKAAFYSMKNYGLRWQLNNFNLKHLDVNDIFLLALNTNALHADMKINVGITKIISLPSNSSRSVDIVIQTIQPMKMLRIFALARH